jgi:hypothetical protein
MVLISLHVPVNLVELRVRVTLFIIPLTIVLNTSNKSKQTFLISSAFTSFPKSPCDNSSCMNNKSKSCSLVHLACPSRSRFHQFRAPCASSMPIIKSCMLDEAVDNVPLRKGGISDHDRSDSSTVAFGLASSARSLVASVP